MKKILLIIQREYLTKVRKRSFIIMSVLGPVLMASLFAGTIYLSMRQDEKALVYVDDETGIFAQNFTNNENYTFIPLGGDFYSIKDSLIKQGNYTLLYIPGTKLSVPEKAVVYSDKQPTLNLKEFVKSKMAKEVEKRKLANELRQSLIANAPGSQASDTSKQDLMSETILSKIKTNIEVTTIKTDEGGNEKKSFAEAAMVAGYISSLLIYMFILLFGIQVMRGVIEEKTNRIVEVIVSSVKPFQLMMGKIIGIALVGLTQFLLWIVLTFLIISGIQKFIPGMSQSGSMKPMQEQVQNMPSSQEVAQIQSDSSNMMNDINDALAGINFGTMIVAFIFYFLFGYLLYAALFAAVGAAVDNETDTQQFMLPITIPLILAIVVAQTVIRNPASPIAYWLSLIPLTSPVVMLVRIPFGVPYWQIVLSLLLLIGGFVFTTWVAARVYKVGILMYGKKSNYRELWKWLWYKS